MMMKKMKVYGNLPYYKTLHLACPTKRRSNASAEVVGESIVCSRLATEQQKKP